MKRRELKLVIRTSIIKFIEISMLPIKKTEIAFLMKFHLFTKTYYVTVIYFDILYIIKLIKSYFQELITES